MAFCKFFVMSISVRMYEWDAVQSSADDMADGSWTSWPSRYMHSQLFGKLLYTRLEVFHISFTIPTSYRLNLINLGYFTTLTLKLWPWNWKSFQNVIAGAQRFTPGGQWRGWVGWGRGPFVVPHQFHLCISACVCPAGLCETHVSL